MSRMGVVRMSRMGVVRIMERANSVAEVIRIISPRPRRLPLRMATVEAEAEAAAVEVGPTTMVISALKELFSHFLIQ